MKSGEDGQVVCPEGRRDDHAVGLQSPQLPWLKVGDDHNLATDQLLRLVGLRNACDNLPLFKSNVDDQPQQLVCTLDLLGLDDSRHAKIDLNEIVDRNLRR